MTIQFLNKIELCSKLKVRSTSIYNYVQEGILPPPITTLGKNSWLEHEIEKIMCYMAAGKSKGEIRELVKHQVEQRLASA